MNNRYITNTNDELNHYGVLGMKWGVRRAAKKGGKYKYTSWSTKKWNKKSKKYNAKADAASAKGNSRKAAKLRAKASRAAKISARSAIHDTKMYKESRKASVGRVVAANIMGGLWTNKTYHSVKASTDSTAFALGATAVNTMLGLGPITAAVTKSVYIHDID